MGSEKGGKARSSSKPGSKAGSKAGSIAGGTLADLSEMEGMMRALEGKVEDSPEQEDDFIKAVAEATGKIASPSFKTASGKTTPSGVSVPGVVVPDESNATHLPPVKPDSVVSGDAASSSLPGPAELEAKPEDAVSVKSGKTGVSQ